MPMDGVPAPKRRRISDSVSVLLRQTHPCSTAFAMSGKPTPAPGGFAVPAPRAGAKGTADTSTPAAGVDSASTAQRTASGRPNPFARVPSIKPDAAAAPASEITPVTPATVATPTAQAGNAESGRTASGRTNPFARVPSIKPNAIAAPEAPARDQASQQENAYAVNLSNICLNVDLI